MSTYAPATSTYLLISSDSNLSNSQTFTVGDGLQVTSGGAGGDYTLSTDGSLSSLVNLSTSGIMVFNTFGSQITTTTLSSDNTISITNTNGTAGLPTFSVNPRTSPQLIQVTANSGSLVGTFPTIDFTATNGISCSVTADPANSRFIVNYSGTGNGVSFVGATSPLNTLTIGGSPIETIGTLTFDLKASGVTAGTYTSADIVVNKFGIITAASNGSSSGGGGGTVTSVELVSPNSTLNISGTNPITISGIIDVDLNVQTNFTAGTYTNPNVAVNRYGIITNIENGTLGGGTVVNTYSSSQTITPPTNTYAMSITVYGSGGLAGDSLGYGSYCVYGGSGAGGNMLQSSMIVWNSSSPIVLTCGIGIDTIVEFDSLGTAVVASGGNGGDGQSSGSGTAGVANGTLSTYPSICNWNAFYGVNGTAGSSTTAYPGTPAPNIKGGGIANTATLSGTIGAGQAYNSTDPFTSFGDSPYVTGGCVITWYIS
jgi:hypothetical protein